MTAITDTLDLTGLRLTSGEGRRLDLTARLAPFTLGESEYAASPSQVPATLDISRTTGQGYALRLRYQVTLSGPCMRCLEPAVPEFSVESREISQPGAEDDELVSPYIDGEGMLDVAAWAHDALALMLPAAILCRPDCAGLCPVCGVSLNSAGPDHHHQAEPDPRWAKLSELKFDS
jgi:uncharacterized protein